MRRPIETLALLAAVAIVMASSPVFAACGLPPGAEGVIETFPDDRIMRYCDGSSWIDMGVAGSPPAGSVGPKILAVHTEMALASDIKKIGDFIYYSDYAGRAFGVIDVSTPTDPQVVGHLQDMVNLQGAVAFDISGNYAYVVTQLASTEIAVIDISDPNDPTLVATADLPAGATKLGRYTNFRSIAISGNYAYLTTQITPVRGLTVVDISTPTSPTQVATLNNPGAMSNPSGIAVSGNYVYVAGDSSNSLAVVDVSTPTTPTLAGSLSNAELNNAHTVVADGTDVFVVTKVGHRLNIIDASNPAAPTSRAVFNLLSLGALGGLDSNGLHVGRISLDGDHLYVGSFRSLAIVDVSNRDNPVGAGFLSYSNNANVNGINVVADDGYVYQLHSGISIHNVSNPAAPTHIDAYWFGYGGRFDDTTVLSRASQVYDNRVYLSEVVAGPQVRLHVVDYDDPLNPVLRGNVMIPTSQDTKGMDYDDGYLYYAGNWGTSLAIVDVSDANNPSLVKRMTGPDISAGYAGTEQVIVDHPHAFLLGTTVKRIVALDISNPASPITLGTFTDANFTGNQKMTKVGDYLYVRSDGTGTLTVVDVSNPAVMAKRGVLSGMTTSNANGPIYADETRSEVYMASGIGGSSFHVIDASDPDSPVVKRSLSTAAGNCSGRRVGDAVFVGRYESIELFNANTGASISQLTDTSLFLSGCGDWKSIAGKYLVSNGLSGIVIIDPGTDYGSEEDAARCTGPEGQLGTIHYSYAFKAARMCNGTRWVNLGPAGNGGSGGCGGAEPGAEGAIHYNMATDKYEFCEGDSWVPFN